VEARSLLTTLSREDIGAEAHGLIEELYPICRSITGEGLRSTLRRLQRDAPLELVEVPTGTEVLDWTIRREWNIRDATVKDASGARVIDFGKSNLRLRDPSRRARQVLDDLGGRRDRSAKEFDHGERLPGAEPLSTRGGVGCQFGQARGWPPRSIGYAWVCASRAKNPHAPPRSMQHLGRWTCPAPPARS